MDMDRAGASTKTKTGDTNAVVLTKVSLTPRKLLFQITEKKPSTPERAHTPKPKRAPWEDPIFVAQHAPAEEVKPLGVSPPDEDPLEPIQDVASGDMDEAFFGDFIDYSVSLKGSEDPILVCHAFCDIMLAECFAACLLRSFSVTVDPTETPCLYRPHTGPNSSKRLPQLSKGPWRVQGCRNTPE